MFQGVLARTLVFVWLWELAARVLGQGALLFSLAHSGEMLAAGCVRKPERFCPGDLWEPLDVSG